MKEHIQSYHCRWLGLESNALFSPSVAGERDRWTWYRYAAFLDISISNINYWTEIRNILLRIRDCGSSDGEQRTNEEATQM